MKLFATTKILVRSVLVLIGIVLLTSVSIDATDSFRSSQSALGILAHSLTAPFCLSGTVEMKKGDTTLCVDAYEASVGKNCTIAVPQSEIDTSMNVNDPDCAPLSVAGSLPWRFVSVVQADQLCARAHKRLLTASEWYTAARGTPDNQTTCAVTGSLVNTGSNPLCKSGIGAFDMIGNVWELVSDSVTSGKVNGENLPDTGYVSAITQDGLPQSTALAPNVIYNKDYFWNEGDASTTYAIMRGGYYGSGEDGGDV